jgi:hypothetical protein
MPRHVLVDGDGLVVNTGTNTVTLERVTEITIG